MPSFRIEMPERSKAKLAAFAKHNGKTQASVIRGLLEYLPELSDVESEHPVKTQNITIRLSESECALIGELADQSGFAGRATWVQALVRANLKEQPMLTHEEMKSLANAVSQLAHVGRNLNQMARALNIEAWDADRPTIDFLRQIKSEIDNVKREMRALAEASRRQWGA